MNKELVLFLNSLSENDREKYLEYLFLSYNYSLGKESRKELVRRIYLHNELSEIIAKGKYYIKDSDLIEINKGKSGSPVFKTAENSSVFQSRGHFLKKIGGDSRELGNAMFLSQYLFTTPCSYGKGKDDILLIQESWGRLTASDKLQGKLNFRSKKTIAYLLKSLAWVQEVGLICLNIEHMIVNFNRELMEKTNFKDDLQKENYHKKKLDLGDDYYKLKSIEDFLVNALTKNPLTLESIKSHDKSYLRDLSLNSNSKKRALVQFSRYKIVQLYLETLNSSEKNEFMRDCFNLFLEDSIKSLVESPVLSPADGHLNNWIQYEGVSKKIDHKWFFPIDSEDFYIGGRSEGLACLLYKWDLSEKKIKKLLSAYLSSIKSIELLKRKLLDSKSDTEKIKILFMLTNGCFCAGILNKDPNMGKLELYDFIEKNSRNFTKVNKSELNKLYFQTVSAICLRHIYLINFFFEKQDKSEVILRLNQLEKTFSLMKKNYPESISKWFDWIKNFGEKNSNTFSLNLSELKVNLQSLKNNVDFFKNISQWGENLQKFQQNLKFFLEIINQIESIKKLKKEELSLVIDVVVLTRAYFERFFVIAPKDFNNRKDLEKEFSRIIRLSLFFIKFKSKSMLARFLRRSFILIQKISKEIMQK